MISPRRASITGRRVALVAARIRPSPVSSITEFHLGMGGRTHQFLLEAGAGGERFAGHTDFTVPLGGGFRFMLSDAIALRIDGIVEYVENPTAATFGFPPTVGVNERAARSTNVEMRAGFSWILGNSKPAPPPPPPAPAPAPRQEAPPPRREAPPPPPAAPDRSGIIRDSLAAVDRARASLQAKIFFDFDRSETFARISKRFSTRSCRFFARIRMFASASKAMPTNAVPTSTTWHSASAARRSRASISLITASTPDASTSRAMVRSGRSVRSTQRVSAVAGIVAT